MACARPFLFLLSLVILLSSNQAISAQRIIRPMRVGPQPKVVSSSSSEDSETPEEASSEEGEEQKESSEEVLLKQLLAAKFDRTAQSVLKAWSFREEPESTNETAKKKATGEVSATIASAYQAVVILKFDKDCKLKPKEVISLKRDDKEVCSTEILSVDGKTVVTKLSDPSKEKEDGAGETPDEDNSDEDGPDVKKLKEAVDSKDLPAEKPVGKAKKKSDESKSEPETDKSKPLPKKENAKKQIEYPKFTVGETVAVVPKPKAADKKKVAKADAKKKVDKFVRDVTLGKWDLVKAFLEELKPDDADKVYAHILKSLAVAEAVVPEGISAQMAQQLAQMNRGQKKPTNFLTPEDILELTEASPKPIEFYIEKPKGDDDSDDETAKAAAIQFPSGVQLPAGMSIEDLPPEALASLRASRGGSGDDEKSSAKDGASDAKSDHIPALANLVRVAKKGGHDFTSFIAKLESGTTYFGTDTRIKRLTAAELLMQGGLIEDVETFLPPLEEAETQTDVHALKIWSQLALNRYSEKKVAQWLEKAWQVNQWIVAIPDVKKDDKDKALTNLIELSTKVDKDLGQAWLNASFTDQPQRGMKILTNLGTKSATMASRAAEVSETQRLKLLRLQNKAVENLLEVSPENAKDWSQAMTLLAQNWLTESETSIRYSKQNSRQQYMQIDMYGNYYWVDQDQLNQRYGGRRNPRPIKIGDMLEVMPSEAWRTHVSSSLHTQLRKVTANLHLRVNEEDKAFPYIEEIANDHPEIAKDLIHEFLRIWTKNHDPNTDKRQRNPYIYSYGFDQKADAIPLTRSKQERNLEELSKWVSRIRKMELVDVDEKLLANAFTTCHSSAEVFRLDAVKAVFGELKDLKPKTIAAICQKIRANLSSNWRDVRNQEAKQTKRREPEVQQEVLRGYNVGLKLAEEALATSPQSWELHLATACLMYDQNDYTQIVQKSSEFSDKRDLAFEQFELAAQKYHDVVATLEEKDQSTDVYDFWFYASLGACDLGKITDKTVPDLRQYPKIKAAIESLTGNLAEIHMAKVANNMFTRMSPIKPEIKFRYLRGGFEIVGEHPRAWEARNLYDYYKDLVSEIKLEVSIDGSEDIGHSEPFGIYVNLIHTKEIERESGGFTKYVQNQKSMRYSYNYGRPTEDYRDKFSDSVDQALEKHFEILSITFQGADAMESVPTAQAGWRSTSFAYILLKPRGGEVDRIAPLKIDMDFLDTSGYVVIPVESPAVVVDATSEKGSPRPVSDVQITQTIDERQANESRLILEISATAKGLVPSLEDLVDLKRDNFEVVSIDDQGVLPTAFDEDSKEAQILSDRSWTVEYNAASGQSFRNEGIGQFSFGESKIADADVKFQRYDDADLVQVEQTIELEKQYESFSWAFLYWLIPAIVMGLILLAGVIYVLTRPREIKAAKFIVPDDINPFTVLTLLQDIKQRNGISAEKSVELETSINRVEEYYFGKSDSESVDEDLVALANQWVRQAT